MRPLSTRIVKTEATYSEIISSVDSNEELQQMKKVVMEEGVCFFMYRGNEESVVVMMKQNNGVHVQECPCPDVVKLHSNSDYLYVLCYGS
jgi:hypothetical protein